MLGFLGAAARGADALDHRRAIPVVAAVHDDVISRPAKARGGFLAQPVAGACHQRDGTGRVPRELYANEDEARGTRSGGECVAVLPLFRKRLQAAHIALQWGRQLYLPQLHRRLPDRQRRPGRTLVGYETRDRRIPVMNGDHLPSPHPPQIRAQSRLQLCHTDTLLIVTTHELKTVTAAR